MSTLSMKDYIIKNHELDKFKLLYLENAPRLIFYASKYVDSDTAEDLVHDIFIKIWQKKEIYSVEEGLKTYLFRSVQNACLDYLKHKSIEKTYADEVQAFGSEHGVVAESFGSLARGGYFAFHNAFEKMFPSFFY